MNTVICKRCGKVTPKRFTYNNKVWGGAICGKCYREFGELLERSKKGRSQIARKTLGMSGESLPAPETKKTRLVAKLFNRIFRRRGVL
jgi:hypothetical protein